MEIKKKPYVPLVVYKFTGSKADAERFVKKFDFEIVSREGRGTKYVLKGNCHRCGDPTIKQFSSYKDIGPYCVRCVGIDTCQHKYGKNFHTQTKEWREKVENTNLRVRGVKNPGQSEECRAKGRATCLAKYGEEYYTRTKECKEKTKKTCLERFGCENPSQAPDWLARTIAKNRERWGTDFPMQSKKCREEHVVYCQEKWGVDSAMQVREISQKQLMSSFNKKPFEFDSGRIDWVQGAEPHALRDLTKIHGVHEDDISTSRLDVPELCYIHGVKEDGSPKKHWYFTDIFIESQNKCIEVKSKFTWEHNLEVNKLKRQAGIDAGYLFEVWIYNRHGKFIEKIV